MLYPLITKQRKPVNNKEKFISELEMNPRENSLTSIDPYGHLTIREAFEKHYRENPRFFKPESFDEYYCRILTAHDIIHFLYGCDTSYWGEALVAAVEFLKTNLDYGEYFRYVFTKQGWATTKKVYGDIGGFKVVWKMLPLFIRALPKVWHQEHNQIQKLEYTQFNDQLDRKISDIRVEYQIAPLM